MQKPSSSEIPFAVDRNCYAVVGDPIEHSMSPTIHQLFAESTGQPVKYHKWHLSREAFNQGIVDFFTQGGGGLNVTVPHKQNAWELADELSERASFAKAVNTLKEEKGKIIGDNTDGVGLLMDIRRLGWKIENQLLVILGAGGAVRGIMQPLLLEKPRQIIIANRTIEKAEFLVSEFSSLANEMAVKLSCLPFNQLNEKADIVINGTSASLGQSKLAIPAAVVKNANCYDMVYGTKPTPFMQWALANEAGSAVDGLGMLVEQAAEAFEIWRGVRPETDSVITRVRQCLSS